MARLREAEGDCHAALGLLEEAERVYVGDFSPNVRPVAATRARLLAAAGDVAGALAWARQSGLSASTRADVPPRVRARHPGPDSCSPSTLRPAIPAPLTDASALLDRLLAAAEAGGRTGTVIEMLVLRALAHRCRRGAANPRSRRSSAPYDLAEPEGQVARLHGARPRPPMLATADAAPRQGSGQLAPGRAGGQPVAAARPAHRRRTAPARGNPPQCPHWWTRSATASSTSSATSRSDLDGPAIARELGRVAQPRCAPTPSTSTPSSASTTAGPRSGTPTSSNLFSPARTLTHLGSRIRAWRLDARDREACPPPACGSSHVTTPAHRGTFITAPHHL